ncbi:MAG: hypothetical protein FJZ07_01490 [Candidatus Nealsonbacteria bacterium]|nr:hypothetical protein [Candidatus Nealsonbacteria bacterium]
MTNAVDKIVTSTPVQFQKPKSKLKKVLIVIGVIILLVAVLFGYFMFQGVKEGPIVERQVTLFLQYISDNNFEAAYDLTSSTLQNVQTFDEFKKVFSMLEAHYSGFNSQRKTGFKIEQMVGKPTLYHYSGLIEYTDGDQGNVRATLVKENDEWKIQTIHVNISIERFENSKIIGDNRYIEITDINHLKDESLIEILENDISVCDKLLDQKSREMCYADVAGTRQNLSICDKIQNQERKNACYRIVAEAKQDLSICDKILDQPEKTYCYLSIAVIKKDLSICNKISDQLMRDLCRSSISN